MGIRASATTIFSLSRFLSSDSLEKDWFLLALTQSTFLDLSTLGMISDISRETPSVNFALRVPPRSTYTAARIVQAFNNEAILAPRKPVGISWQRRREEYNVINQEYSTTGKAWGWHKRRESKSTSCRSTVDTTATLLQHPSAHTLLFRIKGTLQYLLSVSTARTCHVHSKQKWAWTSKV